ncbi:hypothetical protein [Nostoc sp. CALU 546]|uniref:hypothetical protein n=1 Tax=Nostoc sp. CALU 546 TaxID=1867241 RepID=UPI003B67B7AD
MRSRPLHDDPVKVQQRITNYLEEQSREVGSSTSAFISYRVLRQDFVARFTYSEIWNVIHPCCFLGINLPI